MTAETKRILVVDDEDTLCDVMAFNLEAEGYVVEKAYSAEEALAYDLSEFDLILLDIMMGEISGLQLVRIMRSNPATASVPVIFCTAKDAEDDMIRGLDTGADDYITKPYSLQTVLARIRTVLRRASSSRDNTYSSSTPMLTVQFMGLQLSRRTHTCMVDGEVVRMPRKEFEILFRLLSDRNRVFSRAELLSEVWPGETVVADRAVDVNVTRIRQKIGRYGRHIITRSGYGYGFMDDPV
ncbi:response regulator transcription factor [Paramuribaculum intestinale]|uniref:response regulator transcription factor n=1 Tax=Paramuribaculum intestinale TaxID=2094151 RepID=UPI000FFEA1E2|nr:response regulator transcription factor [Paramuribaculum intestinale]RXE61574.1 response regulator transcription factor [Muribaculaceae bacterium Isolate-004 (NCI)]